MCDPLVPVLSGEPGKKMCMKSHPTGFYAKQLACGCHSSSQGCCLLELHGVPCFLGRPDV
eukprot:1136170-Pelagomonas_calceolata.AAC.1